MAIYDPSQLGESDNVIYFNDYALDPVYRIKARSAGKYQIRQQDLPVPFESGSSDFLTLLGDSSYIIQGTMYPSSETTYDSGLYALRAVASLDLNEADMLSLNGYVPYVFQDQANQKQIFMKPLYVELTETTPQGYVQPFTIVSKVIDPIIYAYTLSTASTATGVPTIQSTLTNLITNPSFETNTTSWNSYHTATLSQSTTQVYVGTYSCSVVTTGGGSTAQGLSNDVTGLTPSKSYVFSAWLFGTLGNTYTVELDTYTAGAVIVQAVTASFTGTGTWQQVQISVALGSTEVEIQPFIYTSTSETFYVDAIMLQTGTNPSTFFDGDTTSTATNTYGWNGTANASTSFNEIYVNGSAIYPFPYPQIYGADSFAVTAAATNIGNMPVYPVTMVVVGPVSNPIITNTATGEYMQFNLTLSSTSDQLNITYNKTTQNINHNGTNVANLLVTGSTLWKVHPGSNPLKLTGASIGVGAYAEIQFYSGWALS